MEKENKNPLNFSYFIDDSKMPSPEEMKNLPKTPELDKEVEKDVEMVFNLLEWISKGFSDDQIEKYIEEYEKERLKEKLRNNQKIDWNSYDTSRFNRMLKRLRAEEMRKKEIMNLGVDNPFDCEEKPAMSDEEIDIYIEKYERDRLKEKLKNKSLMEWVVNGTIDFDKLFNEVRDMSEEEKNNYVEEIASYIQEYEKEA